jgi:peptidylprolyl isomerase
MSLPRWSAGRSRRAPLLTCLLVLGVVVGVLGCSDDAVPDQDADASAETPSGPDLAAKPDLITVLPDDRGEPPSGLRIDDLVEGEGAEATVGAELTVHFLGASWTTGREFDATWDRGQPYTFTLGEGEVIPGWDQGLLGMREGGRRALVVPPDLAYGDRGAAAGIAPGETIVFIVDLLEVGEQEQP